MTKPFSQQVRESKCLKNLWEHSVVVAGDDFYDDLGFTYQDVLDRAQELQTAEAEDDQEELDFVLDQPLLNVTLFGDQKVTASLRQLLKVEVVDNEYHVTHGRRSPLRLKVFESKAVELA